MAVSGDRSDTGAPGPRPTGSGDPPDVESGAPDESTPRWSQVALLALAPFLLLALLLFLDGMVRG